MWSGSIACVAVSLLRFRGFGGLVSVRRSWSSHWQRVTGLSLEEEPLNMELLLLEAPVLF